jgi:hypothetical protein
MSVTSNQTGCETNVDSVIMIIPSVAYVATLLFQQSVFAQFGAQANYCLGVNLGDP